MNRLYMLTILLLLSSILLGQVNGNLSQIEDKNILHVWGNHYERGFAQGYLLAAEIKEVFHNYYFVMQAFSDPQVHDANLQFLNSNFSPDNRFITECSGIAEGMAASAGGAYYTPLGRNLGTEDILMLNAALDMSYLSPGSFEHGCASLASWGISTQDDLSLNGAAVITRFLDWTPNSALILNPLLIVHHPSETDEQKWLNFGFPGLIGALSAVSENGTAAFMNTGNDHYYSVTNNLNPILFGIRAGLERTDLDNNGLHNAEDLYHSIQSSRSLAGFIVQNLTERDGYFESSVIETNNSGTTRRYYNQNGNLPGRHLAATNHFRQLTFPTCCTRYSNIQDSLYTNSSMTAKRQWQLLAGAAGMDNNLMAIQYVPSQNYLLWSTATISQAAFSNPGITLDVNQLFNNPLSSVDPENSPALPALRLYPNPVRNLSDLKIESTKKMTRLSLYNSRGQLVLREDLQSVDKVIGLADDYELRSGIYFLQVQDTEGMVQRGRILILR